MVDMPKATPKDVSIMSPATIRRALSIIPKPTKGMDCVIATRRKSRQEGSGTVYTMLTASGLDAMSPVNSRCADGDKREAHSCAACSPCMDTWALIQESVLAAFLTTSEGTAGDDADDDRIRRVGQKRPPLFGEAKRGNSVTLDPPTARHIALGESVESFESVERFDERARTGSNETASCSSSSQNARTGDCMSATVCNHVFSMCDI